ncbi:hypothetical protein [Paenibacillus durus]|uniref:Uncharacterized protein n=1 Tax=Paenibacillus durus ATCC 35681 TaxID=1333534 RepID=A0A0F7F7Y7_PAEDU|nr:hypothetical protein [Paenibacillus durus]AKG33622.1 hypothetical protein VK70_02650 [Paenibacillus durus ATCC 35681]
MSIQMGVPQQQVLYQADSQSIQNLKSIRSHLHNICRQHTNQYVRIETIDGQVVTGRIVNCERGFLHLAVPRHGGNRAFYNPYDEMILTLVLYELLVITLLYT